MKLDVPRSIANLAIPVLASWFLWSCQDTVSLSNASGNEHGLLVDGQGNSGQINDAGFVSSDPSIGVGNLDAGGSNEVLAFTNRRPVAFRGSVAWSNGTDDIAVAFQNEIAIPVTVWIVRGPFNTQRDRAIDACITTTAIWQSERMGVRFQPFEIVDATADPDAPNYFAFTCSMRAGIQNDIGRTTGRINVYYVDTVDGGTGRGQACSIGGNFVAMGRSTGDELLSHEFGHDFALTHTDGLASFDQTNVMHSASNTREFITEGQLFRKHLRTNSAINSVYGARPGQPTRDCGPSEASNTCPTLVRRVWADGTFPAN